MLPFGVDVTPHCERIQCTGRDSNYIEVTHKGYMMFLVPLDKVGGGTARVRVFGYFRCKQNSEGEILLGRDDRTSHSARTSPCRLAPIRVPERSTALPTLR